MKEINEKEFIRECQYRNCNNIISVEKRIDAVYCCTSCKKMEQTYKKRKLKLINKYKAIEEMKVNEYKNLLEIIKGDIQN